MLTEQVQTTLRESQLARRIVGVLAGHEGFLGFYGTNPGIITMGDFPLPDHTHEEVRKTLWRLRQEGLLDFTFNGCGPNVYCFQGENSVSPSKSCLGYMESRFVLNQEIRDAVRTMLSSEFKQEGLVQQVYYIRFNAKTTDEKAMKVFDIKEIAAHYAGMLNVEPETVDRLRYGRNWGDYDWNNPSKYVAQRVKEGKPLVVLDDGHGINFLLVATGNRVELLGLTYGIMCDATKEPHEYRSDLRLMTPKDPFKDPFLCKLMQKYDNPRGQKFSSTADLGQVGLMYHDPKYVLEQICQSHHDLVHQFRV